MSETRNIAATLARFAEGPDVLERAVAGLDDAQLDRLPTGGGWTIRQAVHHLADGEDLWKTCVKMALGNEAATFALDWYGAHPQEAWAERWGYARRPLASSLALFRASRRHVAELLGAVPGAWERTIDVRNPDGSLEKVSVGFVVDLQVRHLAHHVARILAMRNGTRDG